MCAYIGSRSDALASSAYFLHFHFVTSSTWQGVNGSFKVLGAIKNTPSLLCGTRWFHILAADPVREFHSTSQWHVPHHHAYLLMRDS